MPDLRQAHPDRISDPIERHVEYLVQSQHGSTATRCLRIGGSAVGSVPGRTWTGWLALASRRAAPVLPCRRLVEADASVEPSTAMARTLHT